MRRGEKSDKPVAAGGRAQDESNERQPATEVMGEVEIQVRLRREMVPPDEWTNAWASNVRWKETSIHGCARVAAQTKAKSTASRGLSKRQ